MGSSIVMMWSERVLLMASIREARVVDFPLPVGPVTRTRPRFALIEFADGVRKPQVLHRGDPVGQGPDGRRDRAPLDVDVEPEPPDPGHAVAEIELVAGMRIVLEAILLMGRQNAVDQLLGGLGIQLLFIRERDELPVNADGRVQTGHEVEVGAFPLHKDPQQFVKGHGAPPRDSARLQYISQKGGLINPLASRI